MERVSGGNFEILWEQVDQQFLLYLIAEDDRTRDAEKKKLNFFIREYLHFAPNNRKYIFPETAEVIRKSVCTNPDFNPIKASYAWDAIGIYAINLVLKPWRKEFQELRMYCGYFKHQIDDCLVDAELMFELMGFCHIGNDTMTITDVLDPDKITNVSRDSFVAAVECQILREIYENVTPHFDVGWLEILEFRERHIGSAEQAVKTLKFNRRQVLYEREALLRERKKATEEHVLRDIGHSASEERTNRKYRNSAYSSSESHQKPRNVVLVPYSVQEQARLCASEVQGQAPVVSPVEDQEQAEVIPPDETQEAPSPQDPDSPNGPDEMAQAPEELFWDSYVCHPNNRSFDSDQSSIRNGQVILLDSTQFQVHEPPKEYLENDDDDDAAASGVEKQEKAETNSVAAKPKRSGSGQWDDWTYLDNYLEKSIGENATGTEGVNRNKSPGADREGGSVIFKKVKIRSNITGEQKPKQTEQGEEGDEELGRAASPVVKIDFRPPRPTRTAHKKGNDSEIEIYVEESPKSKRKPKFRNEDDYDDDDEDEEDDDSLDAQWQCITCTFLNTREKSICEMCFKSKDPVKEFRPRFKKGVICKKCTFINEEGNNFCDACGQRLTFAAIFI